MYDELDNLDYIEELIDVIADNEYNLMLDELKRNGVNMNFPDDDYINYNNVYYDDAYFNDDLYYSILERYKNY